MLLLGTVGWGLLAIGAVTHVWHHDRLRELLAMHIDRERVPAFVLTAAEAALAIFLPLAYAFDAVPIGAVAALACLLAIGFCAWILRLLLSHSDLPCACSFSAAPATVWSLVRAVAAVTVIARAFAPDTSWADGVATFGVGAALAGAIFVLPDALAWPPASQAVLERARAHSPATNN